MARVGIFEASFGVIGTTAQTDILLELGMMYAIGYDCEVNVVVAYKT